MDLAEAMKHPFVSIGTRSVHVQKAPGVTFCGRRYTSAIASPLIRDARSCESCLRNIARVGLVPGE